MQPAKHTRYLILITLSLTVAFLASLPYLYGKWRERNGFIFLGRSVVNSGDTYTYLSNILAVKEGHIILPNFYTTESKVPFMVRPIYLLLGLAAYANDITPLVIFHLARFILTLLFVFVVYMFTGIFFQTFTQRTLATVILLTSSGIGVFLRGYFPLSTDLWVPEANTFFSLLEAPHFISTQTFLLLFMVFFFHYLNTGLKGLLLLASLSATLVTAEHPFMVPFIAVLSTVMIFIPKKTVSLPKKIIDLSAFLFLPSSASIGIFILYRNSTSAQLMQMQNLLPTPSLINLITGYGLLWLFAVIGFLTRVPKRVTTQLLLIWIITTMTLVYLPFSFQRRLLEGLHIPVATLAANGIFWLLHRLSHKLLRYGIGVLFILLLAATNISNLFAMTAAYGNDDPNDAIYYIHRDDLQALEWLHDHLHYGQTILASAYYSNIIPGVTGRFVYQGHKIQTYQWKKKLALYDRFMRGESPSSRLAFLQTNAIDYIFLGRLDPYISYRPSLETEPFLQKIWDKGDTRIYRVDRGDKNR